jgi:hypothetical protein
VNTYDLLIVACCLLLVEKIFSKPNFNTLFKKIDRIIFSHIICIRTYHQFLKIFLLFLLFLFLLFLFLLFLLFLLFIFFG